MSMKIRTRHVGGITILDLSGRITLGEGSVTIRDAVREVLATGSNKILLNLGESTYIDSSGIGELVSAFTTVKNGGGELKLLNLTKRVTTSSRSPNSRLSSTFRTTKRLPSPLSPASCQHPTSCHWAGTRSNRFRTPYVACASSVADASRIRSARSTIQPLLQPRHRLENVPAPGHASDLRPRR
jgi:anti-sigma B factor antagonist